MHCLIYDIYRIQSLEWIVFKNWGFFNEQTWERDRKTYQISQKEKTNVLCDKTKKISTVWKKHIPLTTIIVITQITVTSNTSVSNNMYSDHRLILNAILNKIKSKFIWRKFKYAIRKQSYLFASDAIEIQMK